MKRHVSGCFPWPPASSVTTPSVQKAYLGHGVGVVAVGDLGWLGAVGGERGKDLGDDGDAAGAVGRDAEDGGSEDGEGGELHFGGFDFEKLMDPGKK